MTPIQVQREAVGQYTVTLAGSDADVAISSSAGSEQRRPRLDVAGAAGSCPVKVWNNSDAAFVDGKTFTI